MENWSSDIDPTFREGQCQFFDWPGPHGCLVGRDDIREQSAGQKAHLFRSLIPEQRAQQELGRSILDRLQGIDPSAAGFFDVKPNLVDGMTLRFLSGETAEPSRTYTALSYCWPEADVQSPWRDYRSMPLSPLLSQHLVWQRQTADEGIWCDQLCINQNDKTEKSRTIGAMDAIYKCARVVVVALEDIEVSEEEQEFLTGLIDDYEDPKWPLIPPPHLQDSPAYMETHPVLRGFFYKICQSRWFTRAWCSHEMRLAQRHNFIIRCSTASGLTQTRVFSFSDFFLGYLCLLSTRVSTPRNLLSTRNTIMRVFDYNSYVRKMRRILEFDEGSMVEDYKRVVPYTAQIQEVFELGAGGDPDVEDRERDANLDRITIVLNSVGNGLSLNRNLAVQSQRTSSKEHCIHLLLSVALAAGDPSALCTVGKPLAFGSPAESSSWLCMPHVADVGSGAIRYEELPLMENFRWEFDTTPLPEWIRLDCLLLGEPEKPSERCVVVARIVIDKCKELGLGGGPFGWTGMGPRYENWRFLSDISANSQHTFIITVAAILDCGPRWLFGMARKCGFADSSVLGDVKSAITTYFIDGFDLEYLESLNWTSSKSGQRAVDWILRIAHWMKSWSSLWIERSETDDWIPIMYSYGWSKKVLVFAPCNAFTVAAVPTRLLKEGYDRLPRVWLLQVSGDPWIREPKQKPRRYFLRGKSILFSDVSEAEYAAQMRSAYIAPGVTVYGPTVSDL